MTPAEAKALATRIVASGIVASMPMCGKFGMSEEEGDQMRGAMLEIAVELYQRLGVRACSRCGCTKGNPCEEGCSWTIGFEPPVCTACYAACSLVGSP